MGRRVGSIAHEIIVPIGQKEKSPKLMLGALESGGYLLSHNAVQYHRRCCLSALCPLSAALAPLRSAVSRLCPLRSLSRALSRAPQARTAHTPHGSLRAHTAPHSATPPPMRHTQGRQTQVIPTGAEKIWSLSKKVYRSFFFFERPQGARVKSHDLRRVQNGI